MQTPVGHLGRAFAAALLLGLLGGCLFWAGTVPDGPLERPHPDETVVPADREAYVGEQVVLGGRIIATEPPVIATQASGYGRFTLVGADEHRLTGDGPLEVGDRVTVFGTLEDESTLVVERAVTQEPSATRYMYLASLLGGLWVAWRVVRTWRFDRTTLAFVPRERPLGLRDLTGRGGPPR